MLGFGAKGFPEFFYEKVQRRSALKWIYASINAVSKYPYDLISTWLSGDWIFSGRFGIRKAYLVSLAEPPLLAKAIS